MAVNIAADGIAAMASQTKMFTGIREKPLRRSGTSGFLAAMAAQPEELRGRPIKYIYIVSDSTGFTASHALTSCMTQFEDIIVDWNGEHEGQEPPEEAGRMEVRTQMFSNVKDWGRLDRIIQLAAKMDAFVVYTLVDPQVAVWPLSAAHAWHGCPCPPRGADRSCLAPAQRAHGRESAAAQAALRGPVGSARDDSIRVSGSGAQRASALLDAGRRPVHACPRCLGAVPARGR